MDTRASAESSRNYIGYLSTRCCFERSLVSGVCGSSPKVITYGIETASAYLCAASAIRRPRLSRGNFGPGVLRRYRDLIQTVAGMLMVVPVFELCSSLQSFELNQDPGKTNVAQQCLRHPVRFAMGAQTL
jgi:hypothetical protein